MLNELWVNKKNTTLKKKRVTIADAKEEFNPNSSTQLQDFLYNFCGLLVNSTTDSGLPSTSKESISDLIQGTKNPKLIEVLTALVEIKDVSIILTTFIPALENAYPASDGWHYLFGSFNLGGTVSGRLSSNSPNLQNIPATGSKYAKVIKSCFEAPSGWIFVGLDFDSLEDKISAVTTKDPNKIKVYTDNFDGHCLRAYSYFGDHMPDIENTVESVNSIKTKYPNERQESKVPTFALTYQGTFRTLMVKCGFSEEKAKSIYNKYHELYKVSDAWVEDKLNQAQKNGYITAAFGLRIRTPLLAQVVRGTGKTPYEAQAEGRTAANALGQSWCMLNSRASSEFLSKVRISKYKNDIKPCAQIHDANYWLIRDDIDVVLFTNEHLVKAVSWQDHPDSLCEGVHLSGKLSIFYPNWSKEISIPTNATKQWLIEEIHNVYNKPD